MRGRGGGRLGRGRCVGAGRCAGRARGDRGAHRRLRRRAAPRWGTGRHPRSRAGARPALARPGRGARAGRRARAAAPAARRRRARRALLRPQLRRHTHRRGGVRGASRLSQPWSSSSCSTCRAPTSRCSSRARGPSTPWSCSVGPACASWPRSARWHRRLAVALRRGVAGPARRRPRPASSRTSPPARSTCRSSRSCRTTPRWRPPAARHPAGQLRARRRWPAPPTRSCASCSWRTGGLVTATGPVWDQIRQGHPPSAGRLGRGAVRGRGAPRRRGPGRGPGAAGGAGARGGAARAATSPTRP